MTKNSKNILPAEAASALKEIAAGHILVGWPDGNKTAVYADRARKYRKRTGNKTPSIKKPVSLALIARTLHYGREAGQTLEGRNYCEIPPRPFMDLAVENLNKALPAILRQDLPRLLSGKMTGRAFMVKIGQRAVDEVKTAMRDGDWKELSEVTKSLRLHGGDQPLIDSGTLKNSVSFELLRDRRPTKKEAPNELKIRLKLK